MTYKRSESYSSSQGGHKRGTKEFKDLSEPLRYRISELFDLLAAGESLGMPVSRPMPEISHGAHELRIKDESGQYRVFYYTKIKDAVLVFHFFKKKSQTTPKKEMDTARQRLKDLL